jgi:dienelactone hydrolase
MPMARVQEIVDGIPVLLVEASEPGGEVVLWMSHLGGSAEQTLPMLERFAGAGHPAVSFDAVGHGSRGSGDPWEFAAGVLGAFRRRMWPILGQTTLEAMRVLTWAQERTGATGTARAGGLSMGGDVAVALAGIDRRVRRVATVGSSPDWSRPGMRDLRDGTREVDQGEADRYARWFADQLDPMRHLERYRAGAAISFELGGDDHHIPTANARAFVDALLDAHAMPPERLRINVHPGLDHLGVTTSAEALDGAASWLLAG